MLYSLGYHIRERLATYLAGKISLRAFEDWFFPETWDVDQIDNLDLLNLVYGIKLRLAEFSNGNWNEAELHSHLRPFVEQYMVTTSHSQIQYGTSNITSPTISITYSVAQSFVQNEISNTASFTHSVLQTVGTESLTVYG